MKVDDINDIKTCLNCTRAKCRGYCNIVNNGGNEANHKPREKNKLNYYQRHTEEHRARSLNGSRNIRTRLRNITADTEKNRKRQKRGKRQMNVKLISFAAAEIMAVACMIKMIYLRKGTNVQTVIQYAALSIFFLLFAIMLR